MACVVRFTRLIRLALIVQCMCVCVCLGGHIALCMKPAIDNLEAIRQLATGK